MKVPKRKTSENLGDVRKKYSLLCYMVLRNGYNFIAFHSTLTLEQENVRNTDKPSVGQYMVKFGKKKCKRTENRKYKYST